MDGWYFSRNWYISISHATKIKKNYNKVLKGEISLDEGFYEVYQYGKSIRKTGGWMVIGIGTLFSGITVAILSSDNVDIFLYNKKVSKSQAAAFWVPFSLTFVGMGIIRLCTDLYYEIVYNNYKAYKKSQGKHTESNFLFDKNQ